MTNLSCNAPLRWLFWVGVCVAMTFGSALAQDSTDLGALQAMDRESQMLYRQTAMSVIRLQAPTTRPSAVSSANPNTEPTDPLAQWSAQLSPEIRAKLRDGTAYVSAIMPNGQQQIVAIPLRQRVRPLPGFVPNTIGLILDGEGHAMLPIYLDSGDFGHAVMPVLLSDGSVARAQFVASDRQTHITVVQVAAPNLRPAMLLTNHPPDGALVFAYSVDPSQSHFGVWTRFADDWGLVVETNGAVAGFSKHGYFLNAAACAPVVRQLIEYGFVQRPRLGIAVGPVAAGDPQRLVDTKLGQSPAIRVWKVIPNTPAAQAGMQPGDLILDLAGQPVGDPPSFGVGISQHFGPTQLTILRQDQIINVIVDLKN